MINTFADTFMVATRTDSRLGEVRKEAPTRKVREFRAGPLAALFGFGKRR